MSGSVLNMRSSEDDDDVAGLLAEDDDDDQGTTDSQQLEPGRSGGFRSKGRRRFRRGEPYTRVRSTGTLGQFFNTFMMCCVFFGLGCTKALLDQTERAQDQNFSLPQTTSSTGFLIGLLLGSFLFNHFSRFFIFTLSTVSLGMSLTLVPWITTPWLLNSVYSLVGIAMALLLAGGNIICMDYWGNRSGPYIHALHFSLSLGLLTGPLLVEPVSHTRIPLVVQTALSKHILTPSNSSQVAAESYTTTAPLTPKYDIHLRQGRDVIAALRSYRSGSLKTKDGRRKRRSVRGQGGGYGGQRRFPPPPIHYPAGRPDYRLNPIQTWNRERDYSYDPELEINPYSMQEPDYVEEAPLNPLNLDNPPEKVVEAAKTLKDYISGKNITDDDEKGEEVTSTTLKTRSTATLTKTTTTTSSKDEQTTTVAITTTATERTKTDEVTQAVTTAAAKTSFEPSPTSTTLTIGGVLTNYGVSKPNVGFMLDAVYTILISLLLLVCLCYHPRQPRSSSTRQDKDPNFSSSDRIFKCNLAVLLFCFTLLHWGIFVSLRQVLPDMQTLAKESFSPDLVFMCVFTSIRLVLCLCSTVGVTAPALVLFVGLLVALSGCLILVAVPQINTTIAWVVVIMQSSGLSALLPASLIWGEAYILMTPQVVAIMCAGMVIGELGVPFLLKRLAVEAETWSGLAVLGATTLSLSLFACLFLVARKHGKRTVRHQTAGYQLANQDDLNQELLDEEEDDDFEVSGPTLRLRSVESLQEDDDEKGQDQEGADKEQQLV